MKWRDYTRGNVNEDEIKLQGGMEKYSVTDTPPPPSYYPPYSLRIVGVGGRDFKVGNELTILRRGSRYKPGMGLEVSNTGGRTEKV